MQFMPGARFLSTKQAGTLPRIRRMPFQLLRGQPLGESEKEYPPGKLNGPRILPGFSGFRSNRLKTGFVGMHGWVES
jgi:hypothetical protein